MPGHKLDDLVKRLQEAKKNKEVTSIGYHGNIVTVWERLVEHMQETGERLVDLGSDQVGEAKTGLFYFVSINGMENQPYKCSVRLKVHPYVPNANLSNLNDFPHSDVPGLV